MRDTKIVVLLLYASSIVHSELNPHNVAIPMLLEKLTMKKSCKQKKSNIGVRSDVHVSQSVGRYVTIRV